MTRLSLLFLFSLELYAHNHFSQDTIPKEDKHPEFHINTFIKKKLKNLSVILKNKISLENDYIFASRTSIGVRKKIIKNLKLGLHYQVRSGQRHDNDWHSDNGLWYWQETKSRFENIIIIEAKTAFTGQFFASPRSVIGLNTQFQRNFSEKNNTIKIGPSYKYFFLKNGFEPKITLFANYYHYIALNYSARSRYQKWYYLGGLYHLSSKLALGLSIGRRETTWIESNHFSNRFNEGYRVENKRWYNAFHLSYAY